MTSRREFLLTTAGAASLAALQSRGFAGEAQQPLRVALIGCGWYGKTDLLHLMQVAPVDVVALCDVDAQMVAAAAELVAQRQPSKQKPPTYSEYEKLLAEHRPEVVLIATPDHWHALPMIAACRSGADVYVQKPISVDVVEGQAMLAAARKYGRTVQVGLQRRNTPHLLKARDRFIATGKLGRVGYVDIHAYGGNPGPFPASQAPPEHLDWQRYVGPAPWVDFNPGIHPRSWRSLRQFGNGQIGDLCVHFFDVVRYFLDLKWPDSISAGGGIVMRPTTGPTLMPNTFDTQSVRFDYGDTQVVWTQRNWGQDPDPKYSWGATLYGDRGTLKLSVSSYDFIPHGQGEPEHGEYVDEREKYPEDLAHKETELFAAPATRRHMQDFLAARQEKRKPVSEIEEGHISSACCILGNLATELGRTLHWDAQAGRVVDDDEANDRLARPYREDWEHPRPEKV